MTTYKTFADALTASTSATSVPKPANDNKATKPKRIRNNTTLPALRWLYDNHPELAEPVARAVKSLVRTDWNTDVAGSDLEMRPTVGEVVRAASVGEDGEGMPMWLKPLLIVGREGKASIRLGDLHFDGNVMVEYGRTAKGRRLEPKESSSSRANVRSPKRNPNGYVFGLKGAVPSPFEAEPYQHPISGDQALAPMYDPQRNVEANRALLRAHGVDGSVSFDRLPVAATKCPPAIANGAEFLGGVVGLSGTSSGGATMWEAPHMPKGEVRFVIEEVAARGTLQSIGGGNIAAGKEALINAARVLAAANDNKVGNKCAA